MEPFTSNAERRAALIAHIDSLAADGLIEDETATELIVTGIRIIGDTWASPTIPRKDR